MYDSIKRWINVPYTYKPYIGRNGAGTKQFGEPVESKCYPADDVKLITDASGAEVVSTTKLYVPGTESIKVTDNVVFNGTERPVLRISSYYRNGVEDIKVVYL